MAVRVLGDTDAGHTDLKYTVCIIGAGIAGLISATRIARDKNLRVVLIESGHSHLDGSSNDLNELDNPQGNYPKAMETRSRALGGTSLLWGGKLLPLSRHDTLPRPHLELPGWPFDHAELAKYTPEIESLMGVDTESYEEDISPRLDHRSLLPRHNADFALRWPKRPTRENHNLAFVLRHQIEKLENLDIWVDATVTGFDIGASSGRLNSVTARNHSGRTLKITAHEYIITAGTLESTRLLLLADRQSHGVITCKGDALGRYFNDHLGLDVALIRPTAGTLANQALSDRSTFNSLRHLHFELRPETQRAAGIGSAYFDNAVVLPDDSVLTRTKRLLSDIKSAKVGGVIAGTGAVLGGSPTLLKTALWGLRRKQKYWPTDASLPIKIWVEQIPRRHNRLYLSEKLDSMGVPQLKIDWKPSDSEEKSFREVGRKLGDYWDRNLSGYGRLEWQPDFLRPDLQATELSMDLAHPAGSTRMGLTDADSVVEPNLTMHSISNLSVASASVFPSSGSANPTLTVMQLAMRAGDVVAKRARV